MRKVSIKISKEYFMKLFVTVVCIYMYAVQETHVKFLWLFINSREKIKKYDENYFSVPHVVFQ
jgi:hypothetical protein